MYSEEQQAGQCGPADSRQVMKARANAEERFSGKRRRKMRAQHFPRFSQVMVGRVRHIARAEARVALKMRACSASSCVLAGSKSS